ncbi:MAG: flagellar biosynthesis protein FlhF [Spirochaetia bacterium]
MNRNIENFTGTTIDEALEKARKVYGADRVQFLSHKEIEEGGVLGFGARRMVQVEVLIKQPTTPPPPAPIDNKRDLIEAAKIVQQVKKEGEQSEMLKSILEEVASLKIQIQHQNYRNQSTADDEISHPALDRIQQTLVYENDFSPIFVQNILNEIKRDFSLSELEDFALVEEVVLKEIGKRLIFHSEIPRGKPRIVVIVGPTGVGKTTSLAKLSAMKLRDNPALDIRLVNLDCYRIGAQKQLETYAEILDIPVTTIFDLSELKKTIDLARDADLILVDTIGKSPYDTIKIAEMQQSIETIGRNTEIHLAISATSKESDVREILSKFELFRYQAVILTKIDETVRLGAALSALMEIRKPISYLTTGQVVPQDIERATITSIWQRLAGFSEKTLERVLEQEERSGRF